MLAPSKILETVGSNNDLYWDYVFVITFLVAFSFIFLAIASHIKTDDHINQLHRQWKEKDDAENAKKSKTK